LRLNLYQLSLLRNFTSIKDIEIRHKAKSVISGGSKILKKKLTITFFKELMQKKLIDILKKTKRSWYSAVCHFVKRYIDGNIK
jgi:hypothetical protein